MLSMLTRMQIQASATALDAYSGLSSVLSSWRKIPASEILWHIRASAKRRYRRLLAFAVAYRWISSIVYCGNSHGECNDYLLDTQICTIWDKPVQNTIQLLYNPDMPFPQYIDTEYVKRQYIRNSRKEPEVPFLIIPTIEDVHFDGNPWLCSICTIS